MSCLWCVGTKAEETLEGKDEGERAFEVDEVEPRR